MQIANFIRDFENSIDGIVPGSVSPETDFSKLPQWDSLALLVCIALFDSEYHVQVNGSEINACATIAELYELVKSRQAAG